MSFVLIFLLLVLSASGMVFTRFKNQSTDYQSGIQTIEADISFTRGPTVNMVNKNAAMIFWKTGSLSNASVEYGTDSENLDSSVSNSTLSKKHRLWIDGLAAGTTVYYQVTSNNTSSDVYHFKTEPQDGEPFKLIIMGDNRPTSSIAPEQPQVFKDMVSMVQNEEPNLVIMSGDYVFELSDRFHAKNLEVWEKFLDVFDQLGHYAPIYGVIGNHDTIAGDRYADYFLDTFEQYGGNSTYFSFDYAGFHFTFLDTEMPGFEGRITGAQYDWLVNDLESTDKPVKYVIGHQPLFPLSHIGSSLDRNLTERNRLQDLFEEENVSVYACGHDHLFNRLTVNGVVHIISGGAGAPTYGTPWGGDYNHYVRAEVSTTAMNFKAINMDGEAVESHTLPYEGPIEIALRVIANNSGGRPDETPAIYFSEEPEEVYYSWDGGDNSTELTSLPDINGDHTLDVYAKGSDGTWAHEHYVFETVGGETPPPSINPFLIAGMVGVVVVVVVIVVYRWKISGSA